MGQVDLIIVDKSSANFLRDDNIIIFLRIEIDKIFTIMKTCDSKDSYFSQENAVPLEFVMKKGRYNCRGYASTC